MCEWHTLRICVRVPVHDAVERAALEVSLGVNIARQ